MPKVSIICVSWILFTHFISSSSASVINLATDDKFNVLKEFNVAKCRQRCFMKTFKHFTFRGPIDSSETVATCRHNPHCYMCFDYCQVLLVADQDLSHAMCSDQTFCTKGCRIACNFHQIRSLHTRLVYHRLIKTDQKQRS